MSGKDGQDSPETRAALFSQPSEMPGRQATTQMGSSLTKDESVKAARDMLVDEFGDWTVDDWRDLGGKYYLLRSSLILHGLYVPHHRTTSSIMNSIAVASRPVDKWTDDMMKQYAEIPTVFTGNSALQERLIKRKVPQDLWNAKQGKATKGTQDVRDEYRQGSTAMADKAEGNATSRSMEGVATVLEQELGLGVEQEKTGGTDFADFKYRPPSSRNNAYEIEQRKLIGVLEKAWPKENQYSGTMDTASLWLRFRSFVNKCNQLGLEEHYLHDALALTCMMAAGNVRDYCVELVLMTAATDWKSVMIQMGQRFESEGMKLARDNRWL
ncbi:hypothetical protein HOO65_021169 [Ceratocystis lukuohia]|uniref:Uncharacterized protein n=1 Tax=Ceratocystis lukuohia TaxID=2019550 RepID=A0ABR4MQT7_9PEZI